MFKFLKELFKSELEEQEISIDEILEWFDNRTKNNFEEIKIEFKTDFDEIKGALESLRQNLTNLKNAEMKDEDKIMSRVKQIVQGHRMSYVRVLSQFADSIEIPKEIGYKEGIRLSHDIDEGLTEMSKTTMKSYQAVQHLFHQELDKVTKDLKQLSELSKGIKGKIEKKNLIEIDQTKKNINGLMESIAKKKDLGEQLKEKGKLLLDMENLKQKLQSKKEELEKSGDFERLREAKEKQKEIEEMISRKRTEIIELFAPLETGLKKFSRITLEDEKLVEKYAKSAFDALIGDKELRILGLLYNMRQSILSGSVDLRDHKKEKTLNTLDGITSERLKNIVNEYNDLTGEKEGILKRISANPVSSQIKEIEYKQEHNLFKADKLKEDISAAEKKHDAIDLELLKKELKNKIKEIINVELTIS